MFRTLLVAAAFGLVGQLALAQPVASGQAQRFIARFNAANTTHDGRLTQAQAQAGHMPWIAKHFAAIDAEHKGYVTLADLQAYRQQQRAGRQGGTASQP